MDKEQKEEYQKVIHILANEVGYMKRNKDVYCKLRHLVKFKGEIIMGLNWLLNWIVDTYTTDIAMNIRRLVDIHPDKRCKSLYKFLIELQKSEQTIINAIELQQDIDQLNGKKNPILKKILDFTNKNCAHCDVSSQPPIGVMQSRYSDVSFDEEVFPEAEKIENLCIKYYKLINGKDPNFMDMEYIEHSEMMISEIDNTFRRICKEKLSK